MVKNAPYRSAQVELSLRVPRAVHAELTEAAKDRDLSVNALLNNWISDQLLELKLSRSRG